VHQQKSPAAPNLVFGQKHRKSTPLILRPNRSMFSFVFVFSFDLLFCYGDGCKHKNYTQLTLTLMLHLHFLAAQFLGHKLRVSLKAIDTLYWRKTHINFTVEIITSYLYKLRNGGIRISGE
jgi:hypothetical protein